jgi:ribosomal protein L11 methyltransferase
MPDEPNPESPAWLELATEVDHEAVESVAELFAQYGYNQGVAIEEPFTQEGDGDNLAVDTTRPVWVRTYLPAADTTPEQIDKIKEALWHLGRMRHVGELQVRERPEEDWAHAWKEHFRPVRAGRRVVVAPPWQEYQPESADDIVVVLDPGMAFGTGTHPTTRLCLLALEERLRPGDAVFDVGAGSGILAIAAAKLGAERVVGIDIDPVAVRNASENVRRNDVEATVGIRPVGQWDAKDSGFDLVVANIISRVLIELAEQLVAAVRPGGLPCSAASSKAKNLRSAAPSKHWACTWLADRRWKTG